MAFAGWFQLVRSLHPTWRKERRVIRACERAFEDGEYKLVRIRINTGEPSIGDFFSWTDGSLEIPRYFTYDIETEAEPDFSGTGSAERRIVRRYLDRNADHVRHHGRETLRPAPSSPQTEDRPRSPAAPKLSSPVTLTGRAFWFGRIKLYEDEIAISGWTWTGPTVERIPIRRVALFETWSEREGTNFRLEVNEAAPIRGRIEKGVGLWEVKMDADERVVLKRRVNY